MANISVIVGVDKIVIKGPHLTVGGNIHATYFNNNVDRLIPINKNNTTISVVIGNMVFSGDDVLIYPERWSCVVGDLPASSYNINVTAKVKSANVTGIGPAETSVQIVDNVPPALSIDVPHSITGAVPTYSIVFSGSATDAFGVNSVEYNLGQGWVEASNKSGDWQKWGVETTLPKPGNYLLLVQATDVNSNKTKTSAVIEARQRDMPHTVPVALFPIRLETRFQGKDLLVRIYPDTISLDTHDPCLTEDEYDGGQEFLRSSTEEEERRAAWRNLAHAYGPQRAAWIAKIDVY